MDLTPEIHHLLEQLSQQLEQPSCSVSGSGNSNGGAGQPASLTNFSPLPEMYYLQRAREHEAFYRLDLDHHSLQPELRVLIPTQDNILKFHVFLVTLTPAHPLFAVFVTMETYQGSHGFEDHREYALWHLLYAIADTMKRLFWFWREQQGPEMQAGALNEIDVRQVV